MAFLKNLDFQMIRSTQHTINKEERKFQHPAPTRLFEETGKYKRTYKFYEAWLKNISNFALQFYIFQYNLSLATYEQKSRGFKLYLVIST